MLGLIAILMFLLVGETSCAPQSDSKITLFDQNSDENGYQFQYETSDGSKRSEKGIFHGENKILQVIGEYEYKLSNGETMRVFYTADENGYFAKVIPEFDAGIDIRIGSDAINSLVGGGLG